MDVCKAQIFQSFPLKYQTQQKIRIESQNGFHVGVNPFEKCLALKEKLSLELQSLIKQDLYSSLFNSFFLSLNFSPEFIQHIIPLFEEKSYNKGEQIYQTEDIPEDLFFLIKGTVTLSVSRRDLTITTTPIHNCQTGVSSKPPKEHIIAYIQSQQALNSDDFFKQKVCSVTSRARTDCLVGSLSYLKFKRALQFFEDDRQNYFQLKDQLNLYGKNQLGYDINILSKTSVPLTQSSFNHKNNNKTQHCNSRNEFQLGFLKNNKKFNTFQHLYETKLQAWRIFIRNSSSKHNPIKESQDHSLGQLQAYSSSPSSTQIPPSFLVDKLFKRIITESQDILSELNPPFAYREKRIPQINQLQLQQSELNTKQQLQEYQNSQTQNQFIISSSSSSFSFSEDRTNSIISDSSLSSTSLRNAIPLSPLRSQSLYLPNNLPRQNINELIISHQFAPQYYYPFHIVASLKKKIPQQQPISENCNTIQQLKTKEQIIEKSKFSSKECKKPYQKILSEYQTSDEQSVMKYAKRTGKAHLKQEDESMCQSYSHSISLLKSNLQQKQEEQIFRCCDSLRLSNQKISQKSQNNNSIQKKEEHNPLLQDIFFNSFETMQSYARYFPHNNLDNILAERVKNPIRCNQESHFFESNSNIQEKEVQQGDNYIISSHQGNKIYCQKTYDINEINTQFVKISQKEQENIDADRSDLFLGVHNLISNTRYIKSHNTTTPASDQVINSYRDCCLSLSHPNTKMYDQSKCIVELTPTVQSPRLSSKRHQLGFKDRVKLFTPVNSK